MHSAFLRCTGRIRLPSLCDADRVESANDFAEYYLKNPRKFIVCATDDKEMKKRPMQKFSLHRPRIC